MFIIGYEFLSDVGKVGVEGIAVSLSLTRVLSLQTAMLHCCLYICLKAYQ